MNKPQFVAAVAAFLLSAAVLWAAPEAPTNGVERAAEDIAVEVVASPITQAEITSKDGANTTYLDRRQLDRLSATDLPAALRQVPGLTISRYNPIGAYGGAAGGSVYIRGMGTGRPGGEVKFYTDGVPRESGVWSHPLMDIVPIDFAANVSVAKNPQPQNYASVFGAVNVETRRRRLPGHEGELDLAYGRYNSILSSAVLGGKEGRFDYYVGGAYKYSEGARSHSEAELQSAFARLGRDVSEHDYLTYILQTTDNWVRDPGPKGGPIPRRDQFNTETLTHILRFESNYDYLQGHTLLYYEYGKIRWNKDHLSDGVLASPAGHSNTDWDNYGLRSKYDLTLKSLTLTAAFDWWSEGGKTWNVRAADDRRVWGYDGRFNFVSPYLGARYDFVLHNDWTLTPAAGLRYYCSSDFDNEAAANLALTLAHEEVAFFTSYARGVHYPGVYVRGVSPLNWPTLTAETLDSLEAGFRYELNEVVALHSSLFRMKVANRLDTAPGGFLNSGAMEAYGLETALHFYPRRDLTIFAGGAYAYRKTRPVSRLPEVTLSTGSSWQINKHLRWDIDAEYVSTQYGYGMRTVNPPLEKIDSFITANTRLSLDLRALSKLRGEIYVAVDNLTGQHYEYFPGYPLPGVMWYAGAKLKF